MSPAHRTLIGLSMMVIGLFKTWLHIGSVPVLYLTTCTGNSIAVPAGSEGLIAYAHCWGCYLVVAGLVIAMQAGFRVTKKRRSVACQVD